jgi:hypothetical protein
MLDQHAEEFYRLLAPGRDVPCNSVEKPVCCANDGCDRRPLRGSKFCGLCGNAQRDGLVVLNNAVMDRQAAAMEQRLPHD